MNEKKIVFCVCVAFNVCSVNKYFMLCYYDDVNKDAQAIALTNTQFILNKKKTG